MGVLHVPTTYTMRTSAVLMSILFSIVCPSAAEKSKISKVVIKSGANTFKCSFILVHSNKALDTQESSISCNPRNKAASVKDLSLTADDGCSFLLSFRIKKGKGLGIGGSVGCPIPSTTAVLNTSSELGSETLDTTTVDPTPPCGCSCDCPDDGSDCDCLCDCPAALVSAPPACSPGFTKICPRTGSACPDNMQELCPPMAGEELVGEEEVQDRILTTVTKTVKISGKNFKCAISISHGCVTTLSSNIKCSPGKPKLKGSIRFGKDGYTFQVDFQTPNKVLKASLLGVPCPKCSCKSSLCSPPCPSSSYSNSTTSPAQNNTEEGTQGTEEGTTQGPGSSTPGTTSSSPGSPAHREYSDEGCSCVPSFMIFFSQMFFMQKNYQDNGFLSTCYCVQEGKYNVQAHIR